MTRSSIDPLYTFDPEIEKTLHRLRKTRNIIVNNSRNSGSVINSNQFCTDNSIASSNIFVESRQMENNDRRLKELATLDVVYQPWCIQYPQLEPTQTYELKFGLIHLLPKFHGLAGEDPHKHLKEFHVVCSTMRLQGILEDYIKMKAFPFSLDGAAKDWLYLQPVLFNTWGDMKCTFLEKFFPASRTASIRKEICGIRQHTGETLHEYWERFNKLYATCPHHQISKQLLIQYFYEGLSMMDRSMIDAASGGALMDKTPTAARHLISNMASNTQQFGIRGPSQTRMVNEIGLTELTSLVRQLVVGQHQPALAAKVCGICTSVEHPTDMCPTLQETESDQTENVGAIGGFQYGKQSYQNRPFDSQQHGRQPFRPGPNQGPREILTPQHLPRPADAESEPESDLPIQQQARPIPLLFPTRTPPARKFEMDEDLLKMFRKVPKYAKFLKELCTHKRKKIKGGAKMRGVVSTLAQNKGAIKCGDPRFFSVPCTIDGCTFVDAMLDLRASINVMPTSIYKSLNFGDLEPMGMMIQLANRSFGQPLSILEDFNDLIFPADFYVLDMEDETFEKGSALILG
ncbi:hypothetical protein CR513_17425, partial [Mucuna pruriens]